MKMQKLAKKSPKLYLKYLTIWSCISYHKALISTDQSIPTITLQELYEHINYPKTTNLISYIIKLILLNFEPITQQSRDFIYAVRNKSNLDQLQYTTLIQKYPMQFIRIMLNGSTQLPEAIIQLDELTVQNKLNILYQMIRMVCSNTIKIQDQTSILQKSLETAAQKAKENMIEKLQIEKQQAIKDKSNEQKTAIIEKFENKKSKISKINEKSQEMNQQIIQDFFGAELFGYFQNNFYFYFKDMTNYLLEINRNSTEINFLTRPDIISKIQQLLIRQESSIDIQTLNMIKMFDMILDLNIIQESQDDNSKKNSKKKNYICTEPTYSDVSQIKVLLIDIEASVSQLCQATYKRWYVQENQRQEYIKRVYDIKIGDLKDICAFIKENFLNGVYTIKNEFKEQIQQHSTKKILKQMFQDTKFPLIRIKNKQKIAFDGYSEFLWQYAEAYLAISTLCFHFYLILVKKIVAFSLQAHKKHKKRILKKGHASDLSVNTISDSEITKQVAQQQISHRLRQKKTITYYPKRQNNLWKDSAIQKKNYPLRQRKSRNVQKDWSIQSQGSYQSQSDNTQKSQLNLSKFVYRKPKI